MHWGRAPREFLNFNRNLTPFLHVRASSSSPSPLDTAQMTESSFSCYAPPINGESLRTRPLLEELHTRVSAIPLRPRVSPTLGAPTLPERVPASSVPHLPSCTARRAASNRDPEQSDDAEEEEGEQRNHVETIRLLVKLGQVTDAQNNDGWTALHRAAYNGRVATIRALCEVGASVNIGNHNGDTPLHLAALGGQVDAVECLIEMGARTTMVNKEGKSAADVTGNDGLAELIRVSG